MASAVDHEPVPGRDQAARRRGRGLVAVAAAAALTAVLGAPGLRGWFVGDDLEGIWRAVQAGSDVSGLGYEPMHWRPLVELTYRLTHELGGLDPTWYLLTNLVVHVACAVMVGVLAVQLPRTWHPASALRGAWTPDEWWTATVATAWFGVWPSHGEAVAGIAGRGDVLMTWWVLVALALHLRGVAAPQPSTARWWRVGALAAFVLALACKESAAALVGVVLVLGVARTHGSGPGHRLRRGALDAVPFVVVGLVWFAVRTVVVGSVVGGFDEALASNDPVQVLRHAASLAARSILPSADSPVLVTLVVVLAAAAVTLVVVARTQPDGPAALRGAAWSGVCATVALVPGLGLGVASEGPIGERLTYLASVFVVIAATGLLASCRARWPVAVTVVAVAVTVVAGAAFVREQQRWVRAGAVAEATVAELARLPVDRPALILSLPDTRDGVPVMRNSVTAALAWFHGWSDPAVVWQAAATESPDGTPEVELDATSVADGQRWGLRLDEREVSNGGAWVQRFPRQGERPIRVELHDDGRTVEITRTDAGDTAGDETVWWWADGRLQRAPGG